MSFGAQFINDNNEFFINQDTYTQYYIGKAYEVSRQKSCSGDCLTMIVFRISSTTRPSPYVHHSGLNASVYTVYERSTNLWEITVFMYDGGTITVYCFAPYKAVTGDYGMQLMDPNGNITFDSRLIPLRIKGVATVDVRGSFLNHGILGLTKPAANAAVAGYQVYNTAVWFVCMGITTTEIGTYYAYGGAASAPNANSIPEGTIDVPVIDGADYDTL